MRKLHYQKPAKTCTVNVSSLYRGKEATFFKTCRQGVWSGHNCCSSHYLCMYMYKTCTNLRKVKYSRINPRQRCTINHLSILKYANITCKKVTKALMSKSAMSKNQSSHGPVRQSRCYGLDMCLCICVHGKRLDKKNVISLHGLATLLTTC